MDKVAEFEVWTRADGMIEISGCGTMARFDTNEEADAYLAGIRVGRELLPPIPVYIEDRRLVRAPPETDNG